MLGLACLHLKLMLNPHNCKPKRSLDKCCPNFFARKVWTRDKKSIRHFCTGSIDFFYQDNYLVMFAADADEVGSVAAAAAKCRWCRVYATDCCLRLLQLLVLLEGGGRWEGHHLLSHQLLDRGGRGRRVVLLLLLWRIGSGCWLWGQQGGATAFYIYYCNNISTISHFCLFFKFFVFRIKVKNFILVGSKNSVRW